MTFYDQVLRELVAAMGGALLVANVLALVRRRRDAEVRSGRVSARSRAVKGSSRVRATGQTVDGELVQAPVGRSVAFALLGLVMLVAGIAALVAG